MTQRGLQTVLESSKGAEGEGEIGRGCKRQQKKEKGRGKAKMFLGAYKFARRQAAAVPAAAAAASAAASACSSVAVILSSSSFSPPASLRTPLPQ